MRAKRNMTLMMCIMLFSASGWSPTVAEEENIIPTVKKGHEDQGESGLFDTNQEKYQVG